MSKKKDERIKKLIKDRLPPDFDWQYYLNANPDLIEANINTEYGASRHYVTYGVKEHRKYNAGLGYLQIDNPPQDKQITNYFFDRSLNHINFGGFLISCANLQQVCIKYKWKFLVDYTQSIIYDYMQNVAGSNTQQKNKNIIDFDDLSKQIPDFEAKKTLLENLILMGNNADLDISTSFSTLDVAIRYRIPKIALCDETKKLLKEILPFGKKIHDKFSKFFMWCKDYNTIFLSKNFTQTNQEKSIDLIISAYNTDPCKLLVVTEDPHFYKLFRQEFKHLKSKNKGNIVYLNQLMTTSYDQFVFGLLLDTKAMMHCKKIYYVYEDLEHCGLPIFISSVYDKELINL